jgi:ureidoglycolate lyase
VSKKIELLTLDIENFRPFGEVIAKDYRDPDSEDENFKWWESLGVISQVSDVSINILRCKKRELTLDKLEFHEKTPEVIIPMGDEEVVIAVAPAGELDEDRIKAFIIPPDKGILLNSGVHHFIPYPKDKDTDCVIIFRRGTGADDLILNVLSEAYKIG